MTQTQTTTPNLNDLLNKLGGTSTLGIPPIEELNLVFIGEHGSGKSRIIRGIPGVYVLDLEGKHNMIRASSKYKRITSWRQMMLFQKELIQLAKAAGGVEKLPFRNIAVDSIDQMRSFIAADLRGATPDRKLEIDEWEKVKNLTDAWFLRLMDLGFSYTIVVHVAEEFVKTLGSPHPTRTLTTAITSKAGTQLIKVNGHLRLWCKTKTKKKENGTFEQKFWIETQNFEGGQNYGAGCPITLPPEIDTTGPNPFEPLAAAYAEAAKKLENE